LKAPREDGQADAEELARTWLCMWLLIHLFPNPPNCQNQSMVCAPRSMLVNSVVEMASRAPSPPHSPRHNHHPRPCENCSGGEVGEALRQGFGVLVRGVFGETVVSHGFVSQMVCLCLWDSGSDSGKGFGFAYAGAREVLRKVEKQTLHWMSLAVSLTLSWDLASLPAFFRARSRFCADLAPCVCEDGGQQAASDK